MPALSSNPIKSLLMRGLGPANIGRLEYVLRPQMSARWGGPLNGQEFRQKMCREIVAALPARAIVETGTYRGTSTAFFAQFGIPVYSVEADPRYHAYAALRLRALKNRVRITLADSRAFLQRLTGDPSIPRESVVFYLDAHWNADLPLAEEIATIFGAWRSSVIMIDDFAVPGDSYAYDDYGPERTLDTAYLDRAAQPGMSRFFPALPAAQETGARRGCVVLCNDALTQARLKALTTLRAG